MSHLVAMRRRIKAVQTIKKITSAMRLISRAFHTRMRKQHEALTTYHNELEKTLTFLHSQHPTWNPVSLMKESNTDNSYTLYIIIGSQKGLCGTFNNDLIYWIDTHKKELQSPETQVIALSRKLEEQCKKKNIPLMRSFSELTLHTLTSTTDILFDFIFNGSFAYKEVTIITNRSQGFFKQELHKERLLPFIVPEKKSSSKIETSYYHWSHNPEILLHTCASLFLKNTLYTMLFESLMGEQSARFVSMDNATRNANNFLETMQLQYNKARQAKITKELTELAGAFESSFT